MTNEIKAKELQHWIINEGCGSVSDYKDVALEMAEWKDQQFKEYLEKKKMSISVRTDLIGFYSPFVVKLMDEIINELFEEIEQDNSNREE